jgi:hypothetical protein
MKVKLSVSEGPACIVLLIAAPHRELDLTLHGVTRDEARTFMRGFLSTAVPGLEALGLEVDASDAWEQLQ